jgi:hypothetical protein
MTRATVPAVRRNALARSQSRGWILAICLVNAACYSPAAPDCGFSCAESGVCPEDYFCASDRICHKNGTPDTLRCSVDARPDPPPPIDAPPPDADTTAPTVFATDPDNGATNVATSSTIKVQFDEPVTNVSAGTFTAATTGGPINGVVADVDPLNYTFTPTSALPAATTITVTLTSAIEDVAGNALVTTTFSFMTAP